MDTLHTMLNAIRSETKADKSHLGVFREFLAHLDALQRQAIARPRARPPQRRKPLKRARG